MSKKPNFTWSKNTGVMRPSMGEMAMYIKRLELYVEFIRWQSDIKIQAAIQTAHDAAAIANNDILQMGPGRAPRWSEHFGEIMDELNTAACQEANEERDYKGHIKFSGDIEVPATKDQLDRRLKLIFGDKFTDFDTRYGWVENGKVLEEFKEKFHKIGVDLEV